LRTVLLHSIEDFAVVSCHLEFRFNFSFFNNYFSLFPPTDFLKCRVKLRWTQLQTIVFKIF